MSVLDKKFIITRGVVNEFVITIKQNDSTLPMIIVSTDTFECKVYKNDTDLEVGTATVTVHSEANGQIKLVFSEEFVDTLVKERGPKADRYYLKPTYRIDLICNTENNGNFVAKLSEVYVD